MKEKQSFYLSQDIKIVKISGLIFFFMLNFVHIHLNTN